LVSGGGFEVDGVAELLELAHQVALAGSGVGALLEVVVAEVLVVDAVGEDVPDDDDEGVRERERGLVLVALPEPSTEPPVLGGQVPAFGATGRSRGFAQRGA
jgi:hypothetical protein